MIKKYLLATIVILLFILPVNAAPLCTHCRSSENVIPIHYVIEGGGLWRTIDNGNNLEVHVLTGGVPSDLWLKGTHPQWYCRKCKLQFSESLTGGMISNHDLHSNITGLDQLRSSLANSDVIVGAGPIISPSNAGIRMLQNSGGSKQLTSNTYLNTWLTEITNESNRPIKVTLVSSILGNNPSEIECLVDSASVHPVVLADTDAPDASNRVLQKFKCSGISNRRPLLFYYLGSLEPGEYKHIKIAYRATGIIRH